MRKAQSEIAEYQRCRQLVDELITVNEKICKQRPIEFENSNWTPDEKKKLLQSIRRLPAK